MNYTGVNIIKKKLENYIKKRIYLRVFTFYFSGLVFIIFIIGLNFFFTNLQIQNINEEIKNLKKKMLSEKEIYSKLLEENKESKILLKKLMDYQQEKIERINWTPKLYAIGKSIPYGVWIEKLTGKIEISKQKKEKIITIYGYILPQVIEPDKALDEFTSNLKNFSAFKNTFLTSVKNEKKENIDVVHFEIEVKINEKLSDI